MATVIKLGGAVAEPGRLLEALLTEVKALAADTAVVVVHGGGKAVTRLSGKLGLASRFHHGVRITTPAEMEVVDMVLAGRVNTELVRAAARVGMPAAGLTGADGSLLLGELVEVGESEESEGESRTAMVRSVNLSAVRAVWAAHLLPIVATVGIGGDGHGVNINADEAARAVAQSLDAESLLYLSDVDGVQDDNRQIIRAIAVESVERLIHQETVVGGMAAKLRACREAIEHGVGAVVIGRYSQAGDLRLLMAGERGTTVNA